MLRPSEREARLPSRYRCVTQDILAADRETPMKVSLSFGIVFATILLISVSRRSGGGADRAVKSDMTTIEFHGIRPDDPGGRDGLRNPERGLRIETLFAEPEGSSVWGPAHHLVGKVSPGYRDEWWIRDALQYERHGLTLAQTYCYLDGFLDGPISDEKLVCLQRSMDNLRRHGLKAVLRFAYERDMDRKSGPELDRILGHIEQLTPVIRRNSDVIFVMQAGFVGAWGEWHSSAKGHEANHASLAKIMAKVLAALPEDRMTQVRVPKYKRWVLSNPILGGHIVVNAETAHGTSPAARIGFNNDGFLAGNTCGGTWTEPPLFSNPGNPEFDYMTGESPYVPVDGELFWADQGGKVDGLRAAVRLRLHHYSSFSLAHSYSEREGKPFSIDDWMKTPMTIEQATAARLPVSDGYFSDSAGNATDRTQFEYIRDHLGYRIELLRATFPRSVRPGGSVEVAIELVNRGFSVIHNPRPVFIALIDSGGRATVFQVAGADPRQWQPHKPGDASFEPLRHEIKTRFTLPMDFEKGVYRIGFWMPDAAENLRHDPRYAIRAANRDVEWWTDEEGRFGVNVIGTMKISE